MLALIEFYDLLGLQPQLNRSRIAEKELIHVT